MRYAQACRIEDKEVVGVTDEVQATLELHFNGPPVRFELLEDGRIRIPATTEVLLDEDQVERFATALFQLRAFSKRTRYEGERAQIVRSLDAQSRPRTR